MMTGKKNGCYAALLLSLLLVVFACGVVFADPTIDITGNNTEPYTYELNVSSNSLSNISVEYGRTTSLGSTTTSSSVQLTHSIELSGLIPGSVYYFNITLVNGTNTNTTGPHTFTATGRQQYSTSNFNGGGVYELVDWYSMSLGAGGLPADNITDWPSTCSGTFSIGYSAGGANNCDNSLGNLTVTDILTIQYTADNENHFILENSSGSDKVTIATSGSGRPTINMYDTDDANDISFSPGTSFFNGGNLGVGTNSPATALEVEDGTITIDQDTDGVGLYIDSEATTATNYGLDMYMLNGATGMHIRQDGDYPTAHLHKNSAGAGDVLTIENEGTGDGLNINQDGDGIGLNIDAEAATSKAILWNQNASEQYGHMGDIDSTSGSNEFGRNAPSTRTGGPVLQVKQDHASDDQDALKIQEDGSGDGIEVDSNGNGYAFYATAPDSSNSVYLGKSNSGDAYAAYFSRNLDSSGTGQPVVRITQDHAGDDQAALTVKQDGSGWGLYIDQNGNEQGLVILSDATGNTEYGIDVQMSSGGARAAHFQQSASDINVFVDQDGDGIGLRIDSEATSAGSYPLEVQGEDGNHISAWFEANVSAGDFIDRTPFPEDKQAVLDGIKAIRSDGKGNIDHKTLPKAMEAELTVPIYETVSETSEVCTKDPTMGAKGKPVCETRTVDTQTMTGTEKQAGRSLSNAVSYNQVAIQEMMDALCELGKEKFC